MKDLSLIVLIVLGAVAVYLDLQREASLIKKLLG